jgi:hypothetical protein
VSASDPAAPGCAFPEPYSPCAVVQDFADEQGQVARLVHRLASPDPATQFAILQAARKRCSQAAPCHVQQPLSRACECTSSQCGHGLCQRYPWCMRHGTIAADDVQPYMQTAVIRPKCLISQKTEPWQSSIMTSSAVRRFAEGGPRRAGHVLAPLAAAALRLVRSLCRGGGGGGGGADSPTAQSVRKFVKTETNGNTSLCLCRCSCRCTLLTFRQACQCLRHSVTALQLRAHPASAHVCVWEHLGAQ